MTNHSYGCHLHTRGMAATWFVRCRLAATSTVDGPLPWLAVLPDHNGGPLKVSPTQSQRQVTEIARRELLPVCCHVCLLGPAPHAGGIVYTRTTRYGSCLLVSATRVCNPSQNCIGPTNAGVGEPRRGPRPPLCLVKRREASWICVSPTHTCASRKRKSHRRNAHLAAPSGRHCVAQAGRWVADGPLSRLCHKGQWVAAKPPSPWC